MKNLYAIVFGLLLTLICDVSANRVVSGGIYYAVAPTGYSYSSAETAKYDTRKYNTLSAAEAALVATPNTPQFIEILGDWTTDGADTTAVSFSGVTTTSQNYIVVRVIGLAKHNGFWGTDNYRLYPSGSGLTVSVDHIRFENVAMGVSSGSFNVRCMSISGQNPGSDIRVSGCIFRMPGDTADDEVCIYMSNSNTNLKCWNSIFFNICVRAVDDNGAFYATAGNADIYSCTIEGGYRAIHNDGPDDFVVKNCYAGGTGGGGLYTNGDVGSLTLTTCASQDTTGSAGLQNIQLNDWQFDDSSTASSTTDLHLQDGSILRTGGTDTSSDGAPLNFDTDIDGDSIVSWGHIGADYGAAAIAGPVYHTIHTTAYSFSGAEDTKYEQNPPIVRKYATMSAAEAGLNPNPTYDQIVEIIGDWTSDGDDTTGVTLSDIWTSSHYVSFITVGDSRHSGVYGGASNTGHYRLVVNGTRSISVTGAVPADIRFDGIVVGNTYTPNFSRCLQLANIDAATTIQFSNSVLKGPNSSTWTDTGIWIDDADVTFQGWNLIIHGIAQRIQDDNAALYVNAGTATVYSSTLIGGRYGVHRDAAGTVVLKNCYAYTESPTSYDAYQGTMTLTTCAGNDDTSPSSGLESVAMQEGWLIVADDDPTSVDGDYHLAVGSFLNDQGTNTSGDAAPFDFTDDIDGDTRVTWSIGADASSAALADPLYWAVAPTGYSYDAGEDTKYGTRKYTVLDTAIEAMPKNPTSVMHVEIIGDWTTDGADTTRVIIAAADEIFTTASNYLQITTVGTARHDGTYGTDNYRLEVDASTVFDIRYIDHLRIDGLAMSNESTTSFTSGVVEVASVKSGSEIHISNCIFQQNGTSGDEEFYVSVEDADADVKIWNCVGWGGGTMIDDQNAAVSVTAAADVSVYSCTFQHNGYGIRQTAGTVIAKNVYVRTDGGSDGYSGTMTLTTCASSGTTGSAGLQSIAYDTTQFTNVTAGSEDYDLPVGSALIDVGTDTSGDTAPLDFTDDIEDEVRGLTWDVGAYENNYLIAEDAEGTGTPTGWNDGGSPGPDWDDSTNNLVGTESVSIGTSSSNFATSPAFTDNSEVWVYFAFEVGAASGSVDMFRLLDSSNTSQADVQYRSTGALRIEHGSVTADTGALSSATTYYCWVQYIAGSGSDGVLRIWVDATETWPGFGSEDAEVTTGTSTGDIAKIRFAGHANTNTFDKIRADDAAIGSTPQ